MAFLLVTFNFFEAATFVMVHQKLHSVIYSFCQLEMKQNNIQILDQL